MPCSSKADQQKKTSITISQPNVSTSKHGLNSVSITIEMYTVVYMLLLFQASDSIFSRLGGEGESSFSSRTGSNKLEYHGVFKHPRLLNSSSSSSPHHSPRISAKDRLGSPTNSAEDLKHTSAGILSGGVPVKLKSGMSFHQIQQCIMQLQHTCFIVSWGFRLTCAIYGHAFAVLIAFSLYY